MPTSGKIYFGSTLVSGAEAGWVRPFDWLALPEAEPESVKILNAVFDQFENFAALRMLVGGGGTQYQVDWGDGTIEAVGSNVLAEHNYDFNNSALDGTLTSRGYKQVIIVISPVSGNFSQAILNLKATSPSSLQAYGTGFLDINLNLPNLMATGSLAIGAGGIRHASLERIYIESWGNATSLVNLFSGCFNLQSLNETQWNLSNITSIQNIFLNANALKSIDCRNWDFSNCNNAQGAFNGCTSLIEIQLPASGFASNANFNNMFANCISLTNIDLSPLDVSNVTNMSSMFIRCNSMRQVTLTGWDTSAVLDVSSMFLNCHALQKLPELNFSAVTNFASFVFACSSLVSMKATGISRTISFSNCSLGPYALDEIYTNLATVVGQTITVSGNYGTATDNPSIAIAKGWTVVG